MFGVDVQHVRKVLRATPIRPVLAAPDFVFGGATVAGRLEVLVDAGRLLGEQADPPETPHVLLVRSGSSEFGLLADDVGDVSELPADSTQAPPPFVGGRRADAIRAVVPRAGGDVLVLALERLLSTEELRSLDRASS